jgi:hypothetical protein
MSKKRMSEILSLETRALLERLGEFEKALTRNSVISLQEIVRALEEHLLLHRRREEEALFPAMARHLPGDGGPVHRRRLKGREHGERLKELRSNIQMGHRGRFLYQGQLFVTSLRDHLQGGGAFLLPGGAAVVAGGMGSRSPGFESIRMATEPVAPESTVSSVAQGGLLTSWIPGEDGALSAALAGVRAASGDSLRTPPAEREEDVRREADGFVDRLAGHFRHAEEMIFPPSERPGRGPLPRSKRFR